MKDWDRIIDGTTVIYDNDVNGGTRRGVIKSHDATHATVCWDSGKTTRIKSKRVHFDTRQRSSGYSVCHLNPGMLKPHVEPRLSYEELLAHANALQAQVDSYKASVLAAPQAGPKSLEDLLDSRASAGRPWRRRPGPPR